MAKKITESQLRSAVKSLRQYLGEAPEDSMPPDGSKFKFDWTDLNSLTDPPEDFSDFNQNGAVLTVLGGQWLVELPSGEKQTLSNPKYINLFDQMHANQALQPATPDTPDTPDTPAIPDQDPEADYGNDTYNSRGTGTADAPQVRDLPPAQDFGSDPRIPQPSDALGGRSFADASRDANAIKNLGAPKPPGFITGAKPGQPPATLSTAQRPPASQGSSQWGPGVLGLGSRGPEVDALQKKLGMTPTGVFDQATKQAVIELQKKLPGVDVDGAYGPQTKAAEGKAAPAKPPAAAKPPAEEKTDFTGAAHELNSDEGNRQGAAGWPDTNESYTSYREDATLARIIHLAGR